MHKQWTRNLQAKVNAKDYLSKLIEEMPRFRVEGMNQAELILHVFNIGFNRGYNAGYMDGHDIETPASPYKDGIKFD